MESGIGYGGSGTHFTLFGEDLCPVFHSGVDVDENGDGAEEEEDEDEGDDVVFWKRHFVRW